MEYVPPTPTSGRYSFGEVVNDRGVEYSVTDYTLADELETRSRTETPTSENAQLVSLRPRPVVDMGDIETYYEDYGSGHPIVVLHGATADHQGWAEQLQPLTDDYRVILYDLRGHGNTGGSDRDQYTLGTYVDDLASFIDALDRLLGERIGYGSEIYQSLDDSAGDTP